MLVLLLERNMRPETEPRSCDAAKTKEFAYWILRLGNSDVGEPNDGEAIVDIPNDMLLEDFEDPFEDLLNFVRPSFIHKIS